MIINELGGSRRRLLVGYQSPKIGIPNKVPAPKSSRINATPMSIKL